MHIKPVSELQGQGSLLLFKPLWLVWLVELCFFKANSAFFCEEIKLCIFTTKK